jgi:chemotaxis signal transduction protein
VGGRGSQAAGAGWLAPTVALTRFRPGPEAVTTTAVDPFAAVARYGFRVGQLGLLVPEGMLCEVIQRPAVYPLPRTPGWLPGLMNLRGSLVPVFDLHLYLGREGGAAQPVLLVLGAGSQAAGIYADAIPERVSPGRAAAQAPPMPERLRRFVVRSHVREADIWLEVELGELFAAMGRGEGAPGP